MQAPVRLQVNAEAGTAAGRVAKTHVSSRFAGINLAFASLLLSKGCNVLFADLALRPEAEEVVRAHESSSTSGSSLARAVFLPTDVRDWSQLEKMFERAEKEFGTLDIVCPGAGIYEPVRSNLQDYYPIVGRW